MSCFSSHTCSLSCFFNLSVLYTIRYDAFGTDLVATGSSDSTVKVFEGSSGMLKATFRGGSGNSILCCDISNDIIVGAGTDKTCRVWNLRTDRMVRWKHKVQGKSMQRFSIFPLLKIYI